MATFFYYGENRYLVNLAVKEVIEKFKAKEGDLNLNVFEGNEGSEEAVISSCQTPPFLGNHRLVVWRNFDFKKPTPTLAKFIEAENPGCTLVISSSNADARVTFFKALKKFAQLQEFANLKPAEFKKWLQMEATKKNLKIESAALELLSTYTLGDSAAAISELEKLAMYSDDEPITRGMVELLTHPDLHTSVFRLTDAIGAKRSSAALSDLRDLISRGENLMQIFFMIVRQFRILISLQDLAKRNLAQSEIAKQLKLHPFVVQNSIPQARNFSAEELKRAYTQLLEIDTGIKTGKISYSTDNPTEFALALEKFIVSFS
jgi:DNA polymerase-3 subunit delta